MHRRRAEQQEHSRLEKRRHDHRAIQRIDAEAERDGDVRVADLRGVDDFRLFAPAIVKRQHGIGQHHQPAAQPAEIFNADEAGMAVLQPFHQPVGAEVNGIGAQREQRQIHRQHQVEGGFALPHVGLQHFKNMEALPEQKKADQHQPVVEIQPAFAAQRPDRAGEK